MSENTENAIKSALKNVNLYFQQRKQEPVFAAV
jgi:hypothetical protein